MQSVAMPQLFAPQDNCEVLVSPKLKNKLDNCFGFSPLEYYQLHKCVATCE